MPRRKFQSFIEYVKSGTASDGDYNWVRTGNPLAQV